MLTEVLAGIDILWPPNWYTVYLNYIKQHYQSNCKTLMQ